MSKTRKRFKKFLANVNLEWDTDHIVRNAIKEMINSGSTDLEILKELLNYASSRASYHRTISTIQLNETIAKSIDSLSKMMQWTNLEKIAHHAYLEHLEVLKKCAANEPGSMFKNVLEFNTFKGKIMFDVYKGNIYDTLLAMLPEAERIQKESIERNKNPKKQK